MCVTEPLVLIAKPGLYLRPHRHLCSDGHICHQCVDGLERGIKRLSDWNIWMAFTLLLFILVAGPILFIVELGFEGVGHMVQNLVRMSTWADAAQTSNFVESWSSSIGHGG